MAQLYIIILSVAIRKVLLTSSGMMSEGGVHDWSVLTATTGLSLETIPLLYNENERVTGPAWKNATNPFSFLIARFAGLPSLCSQTFNGVCSCEKGT